MLRLHGLGSIVAALLLLRLPLPHFDDLGWAFLELHQGEVIPPLGPGLLEALRDSVSLQSGHREHKLREEMPPDKPTNLLQLCGHRVQGWRVECLRVKVVDKGFHVYIYIYIYLSISPCYVVRVQGLWLRVLSLTVEGLGLKSGLFFAYC